MFCIIINGIKTLVHKTTTNLSKYMMVKTGAKNELYQSLEKNGVKH